MSDELRTQWKCPECGSKRVTTINDNMSCLSCGFQEYLYDYGSAWDSGYGKSERREPEPAQDPASQPWDQRQQTQIDQTRAEVRRLTYKVATLTGEKPRPEKAAYKGLVVNIEGGN